MCSLSRIVPWYLSSDKSRTEFGNDRQSVQQWWQWECDSGTAARSSVTCSSSDRCKINTPPPPWHTRRDAAHLLPWRCQSQSESVVGATPWSALRRYSSSFLSVSRAAPLCCLYRSYYRTVVNSLPLLHSLPYPATIGTR